MSLSARHALDLVDDLGIASPALREMACDVATSTAIYRGLIALGAQGDRDALDSARHWLRETRQGLIALTGLARQEAGDRSNAPAVDANLLEAAARPRDTEE